MKSSLTQRRPKGEFQVVSEEQREKNEVFVQYSVDFKQQRRKLTRLNFRVRVAFLIVLVLVGCFAVLFMPEIPQDPSYHNFADTRYLLHDIPNTMDVLSNVPFLLVIPFFLSLRFFGLIFAPKNEGWNTWIDCCNQGDERPDRTLPREIRLHHFFLLRCTRFVW